MRVLSLLAAKQKAAMVNLPQDMLLNSFTVCHHSFILCMYISRCDDNSNTVKKYMYMFFFVLLLT